MARATLEAIKETSESFYTWTIRSRSEHAPGFKLVLTNRPQTKDEVKAQLNNLFTSYVQRQDDVQMRSTLPLLQIPQADETALPNASELVLPSRTLEYAKPISADASNKLDGLFYKRRHAEVDKLEEDPIKSDVTTKTSPVTSSPVSNPFPDLLEVNECVLSGSLGNLFFDTNLNDQESLACEEEPVATVSRSSTAELPAEDLMPSWGGAYGKRGQNKMRHAGRAPADYESSSDDEPEGPTFVDDYFMSDGSDDMQAASLLDMPYEGGQLLNEKPSATRFELHGLADREKRQFFCAVDQWRLQIFVDREPTLFVRLPLKPPKDGQLVQDGIWTQLGKPQKSYTKHLKAILAAASLLTFVKKRPNESKAAAWKYVLKETSHFDFKPALKEEDLYKAMPLLQKLVSTDTKLEKARIMKEILPALWKGGVSVEEKRSGVRGQTSTSTGSTKRKQTSRDNSPSPGNQRPTVKRQKLSPVKEMGGFPGLSLDHSDEWVDEPDVCMFCDDGVADGDKLLCCDGGCMRSFHVSKRSGIGTNCESLNLPEAVLKAEGFICSNCKYKQHQCFACNKLGRSCKTATAPQEVFCCSANRCRRFYHLKCVSDLLGRKDKDSEVFVCPLHRCRKCKFGQTKNDELIKCRRCPRAWHKKCSNAKEDVNLWEAGGKYVLYCNRHKIDPDLLTPIRDHIVFPDEDSPYRAGPSGTGKAKSSSKRK